MSDEKHSSDDSSVVEELPKRIGPYRILGTLGEGGMAVVYLAEQSEPVKRRVALKILKAGMDTKQVVARFESERQALAVLDHPNIAKVFDGGVTEFGRPYFVMEQVHGIPITDYCDDHRLNTEQRVALFAKVCSAVQHAHHKGLIHRDLKPSNLLVGVVDDTPMVKVIDFGIAKAASTNLTEKTLVTKIGQIIGTPQYMSPEQADSSGIDVDTRTDIYSLGVVLYELLVGIVPLDLTAIGDHAMRFALREQDPQKPSTRVAELGDTQDEIVKARKTDPTTLKRQLKGDLDWIVMQAIAKDRINRYETANALAVECRRYLKHEPVTARPPSAGYLLQRFVRRNRLMVMSATIAIMAILAGAAAATVGLIRATEAEKVAVQEAETASATTQFLVDLFQVSDPWTFSPVITESGADISAREVLNLGAERIRNELIDQPEVQASLMTAIGRVFIGLNSLKEAETLLMDGMEVRQREFPRRHISIADSLRSLGRLYYVTGEYDKSADALQQSVSIYQDVVGKDSLELSRALSLLSVTLSNKGDLQEALEVQTRALAILHRRTDIDQLQIGLGMNNLGHVHFLLDEPHQAISVFEEAVTLLAETPAHGHHASALGNLAAMYQVTGRLTKAQQVHETALTIKRDWFGPEHTEVGFGVANLSMVYLELYDFDRAAILQREAIDIFSNALGADHPNVGIIKGNLAWALKGQRNYTEAEMMFRDSMERIQLTLGPEHLNLTNIYNGIGELYAEQERYEEAEQNYRETLRIAALSSPAYSEAGAARAGIAKMPKSSLDISEREEYFVSALQILENGEGLGTPRAAVIEIDFAVFLAERGEEPRAREHFHAGLNHLSAALPSDNSRYLEQTERYEDLFGELVPATNGGEP